MYVPFAQVPRYVGLTLEVRASGPLAQVGAAVRSLVQAKLPSVAVEVRPLTSQVDATVAQERVMATLVSVFGALALTLACTGLYGLLAYSWLNAEGRSASDSRSARRHEC